jgi:hypothetical protein
MDCSGFLEILLQELHLYKGFALENHLYGCLSLWEQWAEGELVLVDGKGSWNDTFFDISLDTDWSQMGPTFGFAEESAPYMGSEPYRQAWHTVFTSPEWRELARVDAVEEPLLERAGELGAAWLVAALPTGELPAGFEPPSAAAATAAMAATAAAEEAQPTPTSEPPFMLKKGGKRGAAAYKKTRRTHGRRSLTPVHCHHTLQTTRRQKRV